MLKAALGLRQSPQLVMTPQLQQAIRLLQLSSLDLQQELRTALERNVMLELEEPPASATAEALQESQQDADDHLVDTDWDSTTPDLPGTWTDDDAEHIPGQAAAISLRAHLEWQLALTNLSDRDRLMALAIIDGLDDDGYLRESLDAIRAGLRDEFGNEPPEADEMLAVLHRVQRFDPVGVAARDLGECLAVQLQQLDAATPGRTLAQQLVNDHLDLLAEQKTAALEKSLNVSAAELQTALALVRAQNPRPGSAVAGPAPDYIVPDVLVSRREGRWHVELNTATLPRLRVNNTYAASLHGTNGAHADLREQLAEARWLVRSLELRHQTLLKVATSIVARQQAFLEHGPEHMRPMILRDVAETVDLHESTISRITTHKYMHTPRGIYEFKYFFSSQVSTADGNGQSATAVQAMIRKLIVGENPRRPLSDSSIAKTLEDRGIQVARRTITKYREAMAIPASHERKRVNP